MRNALHALTDELRRLKSAGVKTVSVSDESVAALRRVVTARRDGRQGTGDGEQVTGDGGRVTGDSGQGTGAGEQGDRNLELPKAAVRRDAPVVAASVKVEVSTLPPAPVVRLPEGDKAQRWAALLALVTGDATCCANVRAGK